MCIYTHKQYTSVRFFPGRHPHIIFEHQDLLILDEQMISRQEDDRRQGSNFWMCFILDGGLVLEREK